MCTPASTGRGRGQGIARLLQRAQPHSRIRVPSAALEQFLKRHKILCFHKHHFQISKISTTMTIEQTVSEVLFRSPQVFFNITLVALAICGLVAKVLPAVLHHGRKTSSTKHVKTKPALIKSLQIRFLAVWWLYRVSFWMSGKCDSLCIDLHPQSAVLTFRFRSIFLPSICFQDDQWSTSDS
jgi:hypothetical protein